MPYLDGIFDIKDVVKEYFMWDKFKNYFKTEEPNKPTKQKKSAKQIATENKEPWVNVIGLAVDETNPANGSFDIDYNDYFIIKLKKAGYPGKTDEEVIDNWFHNICRNVIMENWEQEEADLSTDSARYINRRTRDDGRTEVS